MHAAGDEYQWGARWSLRLPFRLCILVQLLRAAYAKTESGDESLQNHDSDGNPTYALHDLSPPSAYWRILSPRRFWADATSS